MLGDTKRDFTMEYIPPDFKAIRFELSCSEREINVYYNGEQMDVIELSERDIRDMNQAPEEKFFKSNMFRMTCNAWMEELKSRAEARRKWEEDTSLFGAIKKSFTK